MVLKEIVRTIFGPSICAVYRSAGSASGHYTENQLEAIASKTIYSLRASWAISWYLSPLVITVLYRRGHFAAPDGPPYLAKVIAIAVGVYALAYLTRGIGRMSNDVYRKFITDLQNKSVESSRLYDYSFSEFPVAFSLKSRPERQAVRNKPSYPDVGILVKAGGYVAASTFGRWLMYPGSTPLLNAAVEGALIEGRRRLVDEFGGKRAKLETADGNFIDSMFIDRRDSGSMEGQILVITSEGNAAFYEGGCMESPLSQGYSILGWNTPGFGCSTGMPYPDQVHNGIDAVVQYALEELGFPESQVVFFSWSIGGFAASWAAANYPGCKALILDATFDDVLPLAENRMPLSLKLMTEYTVRRYLDLDNARWAKQYAGPIRLIRRTQDEMISLNAADVRTNRGNFLLIKLLSHRYPTIMTSESEQVVTRWLSYTETRKDSMLAEYSVVQEECIKRLKELHGKSLDFPLNLGDDIDQSEKSKLVIFLADKYMTDVVSTHCVPLPASEFQLPWTVDGAI